MKFINSLTIENLFFSLLAVVIISFLYYLFHSIFFKFFNVAFGIKERKKNSFISDLPFSMLTLMMWMLSYLFTNLLSYNGLINTYILDYNSLTLSIAFVTAFIAIDWLEYCIHYAYHKFPLFWKIHSVHHSPISLNWSKALRLSIFESFTTSLLVNLILLYFFGNENLLLFSIAFSVKRFYGLFLHSNTDLEYGVVSNFISSPRFHHWHHSISAKQPINLSTMFPFWDKIFGTYYGEGSEIPKEYGLGPEEK